MLREELLTRKDAAEREREVATKRDLYLRGGPQPWRGRGGRRRGGSWTPLTTSPVAPAKPATRRGEGLDEGRSVREGAETGGLEGRPPPSRAKGRNCRGSEISIACDAREGRRSRATGLRRSDGTYAHTTEIADTPPRIRDARITAREMNGTLGYVVQRP